MNGSIDFSKYSTVLFMDSMVALEGKPLHQLPWKEIDAAGPILVLVLPQVMKEIDKRKRDGRLAKRAREFNRLIGPAAVAAAPARIAAGPPAVDIAMAEYDRISWDAYDDLDPEEGDDRVVAQLLHAKGVPNDQKLLFSYDNNPIAIAARHGIKSKKMPDHWLLEAEPSPHEKEFLKLKSRVQVLEAEEPEIVTGITFDIAAPLRLYRIRPLSDQEQHVLTESIIEENPKTHQQRNSLMIYRYDSSYDERYARYRDKIVPHHAAVLHSRLEVDYSQIPFTFTVRNAGQIQAENLIVTLKTTGGGFHEKFICYSTFGPSAPKPKDDLIPSALLRHNFPQMHQPIGRHEMDFARGPNGGNTIAIHCEDFRHGRTWSFEGIARIEPRGTSPFRIEVDLTASNLHGAHTTSFDLPFDAREVDAKDLVDLKGGSFLVDFPMMQQFQEAIDNGNFEWFEIPKEDDEDGDD